MKANLSHTRIAGYILLLACLFLATSLTTDAKRDKPTPATCYGRIKYVTQFADVKVKVVNSFGDLRVQVVDSFPDKPGKWEIVESMEDFKVEIVDAFEDFTIEYVTAFPGEK